jgi:multiple sugar transport system permease protein
MSEGALTVRKKTNAYERRKTRQFFKYISPWLVGFLCFGIIPLVASMYFSLTKYNLLKPPKFLGLQNYITIFTTRLDDFFAATVNTFTFTFFRVLICLLIALFLSVLLDKIIRFSRGLRIMFYLPSVLPFISGALLWQYMFAKDFGLLDGAFQMFGLPAIDWLGKGWAMRSIIIMSVWAGIGPTITLLIAGLQSVSPDLYESMDIDGAGFFKKFIFVTLPMISPTLFYIVITGIIGCLQVFSEIFVLTQGGPGNATTTYTFQIYSMAFTSKFFGMASAYAWIVFVIVLFFTMIFFKYGNTLVYYEGGDK